MIAVKNVSKFYGDFAAVQDLNFEISRGEIIGILGLNGAGKSTILKMFGTFLQPSEGSISIDGFDVGREPDRIREIIGYLPDTAPIYGEMFVEAYLEFVARLKGVAKSSIPDRVSQVIQKVQLEDVLDVRLGELSHGYRQRVGIASAIIHEPLILILDEPINGLDPIQIVEMRDLIISLKEKSTVILSSHILSEITKTCDRILVIDNGKLVAEGTESDLARADLLADMHVRIEVRSVPEGFESLLNAIEGVIEIKREKNVRDTQFIDVTLDRDVRGKVIKEVVASGAEVLSFGKLDDSLESLFMKIVNNSGEGLGE